MMCGIAGIFGGKNPERVEKMLEAMAHRGPDARGMWACDRHDVILGNVRLAILDLTPKASMPMLSEDEKSCITFNGEIYNFRLIREQLSKRGYRFFSNSDTEVILKAYVEWGMDCLERLRGMFAFALWDEEKETLFLARDRFGIKPLYWCMAGKQFVFASEIKGILASKALAARLNMQALWDYLSLGAVPPPETMVEGIYGLLPGHAMTVHGNDTKIWRYWDIDVAAKKVAVPDNPHDGLDMLREMLAESIAQHMVSDVEIGAFLSGGIDSSTVTALARKHAGRALHTFSIGFAKEDMERDELPYARDVSELLQTEHHELVLRGDDVAADFEKIIWHMDQPTIDGVNTYFVSKVASDHVKVALTGLGGDELFAGYPHFQRFMRREERGTLQKAILKLLVRWLPEQTPGRIRLPLEFNAAEAPGKHATVRRVFSEEEKIRVINEELHGGSDGLYSIEKYYEALMGRGKDPVQEVSYIELYGYMARMLLRDADSMSMAHSIELRVPFLDHRLAEYVFALPPEWKINGRESKIILKELAREIFPGNPFGREKTGFDLPMSKWLFSGDLRRKAEDVLSSTKASDILSPAGVRRAKSAIRDGEYFVKPWSLVTLISWLSSMGIST